MKQGMGIKMMTLAEEWRDVAGFEGFYQVSNLGRVRSLSRTIRSSYGKTRTHAGRVMTSVVDKDRYPRVIFRIDGKHYTRKVHRLVCEAFNGPSDILHPEVDHLDGDRTNACASNLRWVSHGENMVTRAFDSRGEKNGSARLTAADVIAIRKCRGAQSAKNLAQQYGVSNHAIYDVWSKRRWSHVG
jgi:hypothetical protein